MRVRCEMGRKSDVDFHALVLRHRVSIWRTVVLVGDQLLGLAVSSGQREHAQQPAHHVRQLLEVLAEVEAEAKAVVEVEVVGLVGCEHTRQFICALGF